jgi:hypothetical protein
VPKIVFDRDIPAIGESSPDQLYAILQSAGGAIQDIGPGLQRTHSYVTDDKLYCVYTSSNQRDIRDHASVRGIPVSRISRVMAIVGPQSQMLTR